MTRKYTDLTKVSAELNGLSIVSSTIPSSTSVDLWIEEASAEIESKTNRVFSSVSFDEYIDYKGGDEIRISYTPILSLSSVSYDDQGLGNAANWTLLTEGQANDYIYYDKEGVIKLIEHDIPNGFKNVRVQGYYGTSSTPLDVQKLATLLVAKRVIGTIVQGQSTDEGGEITVDVITIKDPSTFSLSNLNRINTEIDNLYSNLSGGKFKNYRFRRYSNV